MDYHLEYSIRLNTNSKHKSLYSWSIDEIDPNGTQITTDQIPWAWTLYFLAESCVVTNQLNIESEYSLKKEDRISTKTESNQIIRIKLRPDSRDGGNLKFSMFGTKRVISDFTLEIRPLQNSEDVEECSAWGGVSYTSEIDFRTDTVDDCLWFYLRVKPDTFAIYVDLINRGAINAISFSTGSVDGFYSDWSPSISTNSIKVLVSESEHKIEIPEEFQGNIPRLGQVRSARVIFNNNFDLKKNVIEEVL